MNAGKSYIAPFEIGAPCAGGCVGRVAEVDGSFEDGPNVGDLVTGMLPWVSNQTLTADAFKSLTVLPEASLGGAPPSYLLGAMGMTGLTALLPIENFTTPEEGQVAFISGAAGAVGSVAGAILKSMGLTVYGSAGSDEKCRVCTEEIGFDGCFNYKTVESPAAGLESVLNGAEINIYYDNVGGEMLDAVLEKMAPFGVIIACGAISQYNLKPEERYGLKNSFMVIGKSLSWRGFIVTNWISEFPAAVGRLSALIASGKLTVKETVRDTGIEGVPQALCDLFEGANVGKMVCKL